MLVQLVEHSQVCRAHTNTNEETQTHKTDTDAGRGRRRRRSLQSPGQTFWLWLLQQALGSGSTINTTNYSSKQQQLRGGTIRAAGLLIGGCHVDEVSGMR